MTSESDNRRAGGPPTSAGSPDDRPRTRPTGGGGTDGGVEPVTDDAGGATAGRPRVLLVEDNPGDARLAREAFERCSRDVALTVVVDGTAALEHLRGDTPLPSLVILDRELPGATGEEVLGEMRADSRLRRVPVVVFTTSDVPEHVRRMYELQANAYVTKPRDAAGFFECIERLDAFWLSEATLPEDPREE